MTDFSKGRRARWPLYLVVSISGAAVLTVEILGTRIIGPYYGVSLFLWSALISITLCALSIGYMVGGRVADRGASIRTVGMVMAIAGIWLVLTPIIKRPVVMLTGPLSLRPGVLVAATILFLPPLLLLGMVSPMAVKLRTASLVEVGRSAGDLYAVSTIASVAAALLTGFVLIPGIGVSRLTAITGMVLLVTGAACVLGGRGRSAGRVSSAAAMIVIAAGSLFLVPDGRRPSDGTGLIAFAESPYAEIRVVEHRGARFLLIDGGIHTFVDVGTGRNLFPYVHVVELTRDMFDAPGEMLLVGLGGGTLARDYSGWGWDVDAVEIDPEVVRLAGEYFGLKPEDADVTVMDGRRFLAETEKKYDLIVLDAFGSGSVPFHMITMEAFRLVSERLSPGGIVAVNLQSIGWKSNLLRSVAATLVKVFADHLVLPIAEPPDRLGNVILLASDRALEIPGGLPDPESRFDAEYDRIHAWDNRFVPDDKGVQVLTDEHNPIAVWSEQVNLAEREHLNEFFRGLEAARW